MKVKFSQQIFKK